MSCIDPSPYDGNSCVNFNEQPKWLSLGGFFANCIPHQFIFLPRYMYLKLLFCSLLMIWETFPFLHCWQTTLHYFHYLRKFLIDVWFVIECEGAWSRFRWKFQVVFLLSSILSNFLHSSCRIISDISNSHLNCKVSLKS